MASFRPVYSDSAQGSTAALAAQYAPPELKIARGDRLKRRAVSGARRAAGRRKGDDADKIFPFSGHYLSY